MSQEKHGLFGYIIRRIMVVLFAMIGVVVIAINSIALAKHYYAKADQWLVIVNLVFGCCLLTSPFFLQKADRGILFKTIQIIMVIVFVGIGILYIATGSHGLVKHLDKPWINIVHIVFGSLLLTSPYFLKKD